MIKIAVLDDYQNIFQEFTDLDQYKKTHKEVETFVNPIFQNMLSSAYHYEPDTKKLKCVIKG